MEFWCSSDPDKKKDKGLPAGRDQDNSKGEEVSDSLKNSSESVGSMDGPKLNDEPAPGNYDGQGSGAGDQAA